MLRVLYAKSKKFVYFVSGNQPLIRTLYKSGEGLERVSEAKPYS